MLCHRSDKATTYKVSEVDAERLAGVD